MILPSLPEDLLDFAHAMTAKLKLRQSAWKEFEEAIPGKDSVKAFAAWDQARRELQRFQGRRLAGSKKPAKSSIRAEPRRKQC